MGPITIDQSHTVMAILATNCGWPEIDFELSGLQELMIRDPKGAGRQFQAFLKNGCRLMIESFFRDTGELTIQIPAQKRPTLAELQAERSWIKEIIRDTSPEQPVTLVLGTVLRPEKTRAISGPEYRRRIAPIQDSGRALGWQHRKWFREHQDEISALKPLLGKIYIDFLGLEVLDDDDNRNYPFLGGHDGRWDDDWGWIDGGFRPVGRIAVSASSNPPVPAP